MNLNNPNVNDFRKMLANNDDTKNSRIVVDKNGNVSIICPDGISPSRFETDYQFYYEIFVRGNGYTGLEASKDDKHVNEHFNSLVKHWNNGKKSIVEFL